MQHIFDFQTKIVKTVRINYLLHLPEGYEAGAQKWPLILFLHGSGERGSDPEKVRTQGLPKRLEEQPDFPFVVVSPQCPDHAFWAVEEEALMALLDEILTRYSIDPERVYLTGLSMGGYGTWGLAVSYPERFAAIAPICGGGNPVRAAELKEVPVWAFHGAQDKVVPLREGEAMVEAVREIGGNVKFTVYPDADHDSWTETYKNPELYAWFLEHSLAGRK